MQKHLLETFWLMLQHNLETSSHSYQFQYQSLCFSVLTNHYWRLKLYYLKPSCFQVSFQACSWLNQAFVNLEKTEFTHKVYLDLLSWNFKMTKLILIKNLLHFKVELTRLRKGLLPKFETVYQSQWHFSYSLIWQILLVSEPLFPFSFPKAEFRLTESNVSIVSSHSFFFSEILNYSFAFSCQSPRPLYSVINILLWVKNS